MKKIKSTSSLTALLIACLVSSFAYRAQRSKKLMPNYYYYYYDVFDNQLIMPIGPGLISRAEAESWSGCNDFGEEVCAYGYFIPIGNLPVVPPTNYKDSFNTGF